MSILLRQQKSYNLQINSAVSYSSVLSIILVPESLSVLTGQNIGHDLGDWGDMCVNSTKIKERTVIISVPCLFCPVPSSWEVGTEPNLHIKWLTGKVTHISPEWDKCWSSPQPRRSSSPRPEMKCFYVPIVSLSVWIQAVILTSRPKRSCVLALARESRTKWAATRCHSVRVKVHESSIKVWGI